MLANLKETANSPGRRISFDGLLARLSPTRSTAQANLPLPAAPLGPPPPTFAIGQPAYGSAPRAAAPAALSLASPTQQYVPAYVSTLAPRATPNVSVAEAREPEVSALDGTQPIRVHLGDAVAQYDRGVWSIDGASVTSAQVEELKAANRELQAANSLLKFKVAYLMDALATTKLDALQLQGDKADEALRLDAPAAALQ